MAKHRMVLSAMGAAVVVSAVVYIHSQRFGPPVAQTDAPAAAAPNDDRGEGPIGLPATTLPAGNETAMPPESAAVESSAGPRAGELPLELPSGATALAPLMLTGDFPLYLTVVAQPTPGENPSGCKKLDVLLAVGRDDPPG